MNSADGKEKGAPVIVPKMGDALFTRCLFEFDFRIVLTGAVLLALQQTYYSCPPAHPGLQDMFARGGRFPPEKPSAVPGPNAYDPQDPDYDAYKHGAFLEKSTRFLKQKAAEGPGPGTHPHAGTTKSPSKSMRPSSDRTASLQRRVEDLERQLQECKKTHYADNERYRFELNRAQKTNIENTERIDKLKKQNDILESRSQELKKLGEKDKTEVKELRAKLRVSEYERTQMSSKQGEVADLKKALHALDAKRRDELRDKDRRVAEVEKLLLSEKKKRDAAEARLAEVSGKRGADVQAAKDIVRAMDAQLQDAKAEAQQAKSSLTGIQARSAHMEEALLGQLEQHRDMLSRIADEYGRLASNTVSRHEHNQVKRDLTVSQLRVLRLERKLANSEAQVVEVANLVRHTTEDNKFLECRLQEVEQEAAYYSNVVRGLSSELARDPRFDHELDEVLDTVRKEIRDTQIAHRLLETDLDAYFSTLQQLKARELLLHLSVLSKRLEERDTHIQSQTTQLSTAEAKRTELLQALAALQEKGARNQQQLVETTSSLAEAQGRAEVLKNALEQTRVTTQNELERMEKVVAQEKAATQKLASTVRQSRQAEDALREEIEQLTSDLADAERYVEAYNNLIVEVGVLVKRNALAEEEAARLSQFNAEILGHNNPAQRIVYVDRIRRELHETKQKLILMTREKESVLEDNNDLQYELNMYKSVAIPTESRPRTMVTRVTRMPLTNQNQNVMSTYLPPMSTKKATNSAMEYEEGHMTLDEIS